MSNNTDNFSNNVEVDNSMEISFVDIFKAIKKSFLWIVLITLITTLCSLVVTRFFITPKYTSSVMVYVYNDKEGGYTSSDITLSKNLVNTYTVMLKSDTFLTQIINQLNLDMSCSQLKKMITASSVNNTEVFKIYVEHTDPMLARDVADAISQLAPSFLEAKTHAGSVEIVDYAQLPTKPTSPSTTRNMAIGFLIGFICSVAVVVVVEIFDTKIHDESDLVSKFDVPLLGGVPNMAEDKKEA